MKNKSRVILSAVLSIVVCLSVIAGATFALFTSETQTNIAVTAGKVDVSATIDSLELYSPAAISSDGVITNDANVAGETFYNGGTATLDGAKLTLDKITPGDKATFKIRIANNSNVAVQYRSVVRTLSDSGLFDGLNVVIGDIFDGNTKYSKWETLSVDEKEVVLECYVELPANAINDYQEKSCDIIFTVEAVQSNTDTTNNVAMIGSTGYATLEGAISAVQAGETVEIILPGTYAPFIVDKDNVTIKGINTGEKSTSTVIKNTSTNRIIIGSGTVADKDSPTRAEIHSFKGVDGVTLENLWIDSTTTPADISWDMNMAIIATPYYESVNEFPTNVTITGCYIEGDGSQTVALGLGDGFKFTNNTVKNFSTGFYAETYLVKSQVFSGNTLEGVKNAVNYVMYKEQTTGVAVADITITDNTVLDSTVFTIWDYAQWETRNDNESVSGFKNFTVSGNNGNIVYNLTHYDYKTETPGTVTLGEGNQKINYINVVAFDIPAADMGNYTVINTDGTDLDRATQGRNNLAVAITVGGVEKAATNELASGDYLLVDNTTGIKYPFTVATPNCKQQYISLDNVAITSAEDLYAFANDVNNNRNTYEGKTVVLTADIDLKNAAWTPIGATGSNTFFGTFDGQGHTISNLNVDTTGLGRVNSAAAGLFGWLEDHSSAVRTTVKNLTIDGVTVNSGKYAGAVAGYTSVYVTIENCTVKNATINGTRSGAVIGYQDTDVVVKSCVADTATVTGTESVGEIAGLMQNAALVTDCSAANVKLIVSGQEAFETAIANKAATINLADGNYTMVNTSYNVTITGGKGAVLFLPAYVTGSGNTITFNDITVVGCNEGESYGFYTHQLNGAAKAVYNNCTIKGLISAYCNSNFVGCTFENTFEDQYSVFCYGPANATFNFTDCTFNTACSKAIKLYNEGTGAMTLNVTNCSFYASATKKAAVEIDSTYATNGYTVNISGCTANEFYEKLYNVVGNNATLNAYDTIKVEDTNGVTKTEFTTFMSSSNSIDFNNTTVEYMNSVTISASSISNMNSDGIRYGCLTGDTVFENCTFTATAADDRAFHIDTVNGGGTATLVFKNCTFAGWIAIGSDVTNIYFENCTFADGQKYNFINSYQNMTFTNCTFEDGFGIDDELAGEQTWTFTNCTGLPETLNATGSYTTVVIDR